MGILLVVRLIPPELMAEFWHEAVQRGGLPAHWGGAAVIIALFTFCTLYCGQACECVG